MDNGAKFTSAEVIKDFTPKDKVNEEAGLLEAAPPIDQDTYHQNSKEELATNAGRSCSWTSDRHICVPGA